MHRENLNEMRKEMTNVLAHSTAMSEVMAPSDQLHSIVSRAKVMCDFVDGNLISVEERMTALSKKMVESPTIKRSEELVRKWRSTEHNLLLRYTELSDCHVEESDVWTKLLATMGILISREQLDNTLLSSDVLAFVEGPTDVLVFREFAEKLRVESKIGFIDTEG